MAVEGGDFRSPAFWSALCPGLTVSAGPPATTGKPAPDFVELCGENESVMRARMDRHGYFIAPPPDPVAGAATLVTLEALADAVVRLKKAGWPSTFLLVYDAVWQLQRDIVAPIMHATTGNPPNCDMLALLIDPAEGAAGFTPHRDRQPKDVPNSFRPDGSPKYSTAWLALRDATTENSCLYFIPREADPGYVCGDGDGPNDDMLRDALSSKTRYQDIRAVPLRRGGAVFFSHRLIHWGSRGVEYCKHPRVALSFAFSDPDFEEPYLAREDANAPDFELRVALAAAQMLVYHERFEPSSADLRVYVALYRQSADRFTESYRRKVNLDFIAAVKDAEAREAAAAAKLISGEEGGAKNGEREPGSVTHGGALGDDEDDVLDDAMDAMLDAVNDGYGDFEDNFDEALSDPDEVDDTHGEGNNDDDDDGDVGQESSDGDEVDEDDAAALGEEECARKRVDEGDEVNDNDTNGHNEAGTAHPEVQQPIKKLRRE